MILTEHARIVSLVSAVSLVIGFAAGVWWATPEATTFPPIIGQDHGQDQAECSTEIVAAPKNRLTLPDGTSIESDEPITLDVSESGDGATFASSGEARSPGIRTDSAEIAGKMGFNSGTPPVVLPAGSVQTSLATAASGAFDIVTQIRGGNWIALLLGALILAATGYSVYRLLPLSRKQALSAGVIGGALGGLLVAGGLNPDATGVFLLAALGVALLGAGAYVVLAMRASNEKKLADEKGAKAFAYDSLANFYWDDIIVESPDAAAMKEKAERLAPARGLVEAHNSLL